jgi:hypothetical protein
MPDPLSKGRLPAGNPLADNPLQTREDVEQAARDLYEPLVAQFSPGGALLRLGGPEATFPRRVQELEGFARPLWGIASLGAGGGEFEHWALVRRGLVAGTDPQHREFWGTVGPRDQRTVEMAAIGAALLLAPGPLWEPLSPAEQAQIVAWLETVDVHPTRPNNWSFFPVLVDLGLRRVGARSEASAVALAALAAIDDCHLGGGWYADGPGGAVDWYGAFAFHVYGLLYAASGLGTSARSEEFRARARAFARDHARWFAPDGAALPFGRSLTYRFAQSAFWGALAVADVEALPWGELKGLYLRNLRYWARLPIFDRDGVLSIGYAYANGRVRETYISPCSPYWAMKAFLPLAAVSDHPFWASEEQPLRLHAGAAEHRHARMAVSSDAEQVLAVGGGWSAPPFVLEGRAKYARLAYSSLGGPCLEFADGPDGTALDSTLSVVLGRDRRVRDAAVDIEWDADAIASRWTAEPGVTVDTVVWGQSPWHVRLHLVETDRPLLFEEWGMSLGYELDDVPSTGLERQLGVGSTVATSRHGRSGMLDPVAGRGADLRRTAPSADVAWPWAIVPLLTAPLSAGRYEFTTLVFRAGRAGLDAWTELPAIPDHARRLLAARSGTATIPRRWRLARPPARRGAFGSGS